MDDPRGTERLQSRAVITAILHALDGIRYGSVEIIVHDARVVQIERKERLRLTSDDGKERS